MALGERAALVGFLSQLQPALAIEVGTAQGGSLRPIATHAQEVHSLDLNFVLEEGLYPNVTFHRGDSHVLLPQLLDQFAREGRTADFVLIDGDHTRHGVRRDLEHVLKSSAARSTVVLLHDMMNPQCRQGVEDVGLGSYPHIVYVDLDVVPNVRRIPALRKRWGGLGIIVIEQNDANYRVFDNAIARKIRTSPAREMVRALVSPAREASHVVAAGRRRARALLRPRS